MTPEERAAEITKGWGAMRVWACPETASQTPFVVIENAGDWARELIADAIRAAVAEERERCAKIVEQFDATDTDGEFVVPGLAVFDDRCQCYVPQVGAIAAHIRGGAAAALDSAAAHFGGRVPKGEPTIADALTCGSKALREMAIGTDADHELGGEQ